ncbi:bifunctional folylpolyglutamate synthase/dihydrofolate synthase [Lachnoanaerobaculum gingivalis]|uniref:bifunctional folylpolyglutamate synthase/dihydrofolate synthase n=1 Tax=Lachnoanaerobaculum gingivalis TaxID=2490855 RepID=UPI0028D4FAF8|nr:Mur ligase family protein [Lachnoanaerobaculum gingivalis]
MNEKEYIESIPMWAKKKNSLSEVKRNIEILGIKLPKVIHVAGTNGKGSVCAYLSNILIENHMKVGTFISPHLIEVNERILLDMIPISDPELESISKYVRERLSDKGTSPTYFEYIFYIATVFFSRTNLDYVILETGMGGRLDVTNVFEDTLSIITSIGMDHMQFLGNSIKEIAYEKAGIIKHNSTVIFDDSNEEVDEIIREFAKAKAAKIIPLSDFDYESLKFTYVKYKKKAAALAILGAGQLLNTIDNIDEAITKTVWHGRMEEIEKDIIIDGAHNEPAIIEFTENAMKLAKANNKKIKLLISVVKDKEVEKIFDIITSKLDVKKYYLTAMNSYRSNSTDELYNSLNILLEKNKRQSKISCYNSSTEAFNEAKKEKADDEILFCVGSLYLMGEILEVNR